MNRPSKMTSEDIWRYIMGGKYIYTNGLPQLEEKLTEAIRKEKLNRQAEKIGEYCGIFLVLAIYAGIFYFISKLFFSLSYFQAFGLTIGIFCVAKVFNIPHIRFWTHTLNRMFINGKF